MRALLALLALTLPVSADPVVRVPYAELEGRLVARIDFEDYPRHLSPGTKLDGIQPAKGAAFGERFEGQTLLASDGYDVVVADPAGPLRLAAGAPGENLSVSFIYMLSNQLEGLASPGYPAREASGEGAVAVLFERDQFALGFRVAAEPQPRDGAGEPGRMTVAFYRRDGVRIAELEIALDWGRGDYGFLREGEAADIAGITITNRDPAGIAIDDLIFDNNLAIGQAIFPPYENSKG
ncbi:MAG: hypothetical protein AAF771_01420 [Pseudomonadota bacterium]